MTVHKCQERGAGKHLGGKKKNCDLWDLELIWVIIIAFILGLKKFRALRLSR